MLAKRIRQANSLAMSQESLSLHGLRLIYSVVANLKVEQEDFDTVEIPLTEMQDILQVSQKNVYRDSKRAALELLNQTILLGDDENGWIAFQWASVSQYIPAKKHPQNISTIKIKLHEYLKPYLLQLKTHFNSFPQQVLYEVNSQYVFKLFQILWFESHSGKRSPLEFGVEEFRKRLNLDDKYAGFGSFKRYLLSLLDQLNASNLGIHVSLEKLGHPVTTLRFKIQVRNEVQELLNDSEKDLLEKLKKMGFFNPLEAIRQHGETHVSQCLKRAEEIIEEARNKTPIKNPAALLQHLLSREIDVEILDVEEESDQQQDILELINSISLAFDQALLDYSQQLWKNFDIDEQQRIQADILARTNQVVSNQILKSGWMSRIGQTSILRYLEKDRAEKFAPELRSIRKFACLKGFNTSSHFEEAIVILEQTYP